MSSEEEDYMSDSFLLKCEKSCPGPGLAPKSLQKQYARERKQNVANKQNVYIPKKQVEARNREEGLNTSISSVSKGFKMLQKMGYKPGSGIGKQETGRTDPISIEVKAGRAGLGRESDLKRKAIEMNRMRESMVKKRQKLVEKQKLSFMERMSGKFTERNVEKDLRIAQKACLQLDQEQGVQEPKESFFWPLESRLQSNVDGNEVDEDQELRRFSNTYTNHPVDDVDSDDDTLDSNNDDDLRDNSSDLDELTDLERLPILTNYLRMMYIYCIWCGTRYDDQNDLESNCPGNSADAHD